VGAVAIYYSISLFLASPNQATNSTPLRVSQWSGYMIASDIQNRSAVVSGVSASWTVPEVQPSENSTFSGLWVGIGGYGEKTLIQTGTEQEYINGRVFYYAWYELLPDYLVRIPNLRIRPGDTISASIGLISENANTWSIEISDVTRGQHFEKVVVYNSSRLSAEWIVERPKVNDTITTLADFGNVTFTECEAIIDGFTGAIGNFSYTQLLMVGADENHLVSVSSLDGDGSSFTVSYLKPLNAASQDDLHFNSFTVLPLAFFCLGIYSKIMSLCFKLTCFSKEALSMGYFMQLVTPEEKDKRY
jgi:hypothetical protein